MGARSRVWYVGCSLALSLTAPSAGAGVPIRELSGGIESYHESRLDNGLRVVLGVDRRVPQVAVHVHYVVGDALDPPAHRGLAQLIGSLLPEVDTRHLKARERHRLIEAAGFKFEAAKVDVDLDSTALWIQVPSDALELALFIEADRMGFAADGIAEESLQLGDSLSKAWNGGSAVWRYDGLSLWAGFGPEHPYAVLAAPLALGSVSARVVRERMSRYYNPATAIVAVVGDLQPEPTLRMIRRFFGALPAAPIALPEAPASSSASQHIELLANTKAKHSSRVWRSAAHLSADDSRLDVLARLLRRQLQSRSIETKICDRIEVSQRSKRLGSSFHVACVHGVGHDESEWNAVVDELLSAVFEERLNADAVEAAAIAQTIEYASRYEGLATRARFLSQSLAVLGNVRFLPQYLEQCLSTDVAALGDVARRYLRKPAAATLLTKVDPHAPEGGRVVSSFNPPRYEPPPVAGRVDPKDGAVWYRPPAVPSQRKYTPPRAITETLASGTRLRFVAHRGMPLAEAHVVLPWNGSIESMAASVLAALLEMADVDGRTLESRLEDLGAELTMHAGSDVLSARVVAHPERLAPALQLLGRALSAPRFSDARFKKIKSEKAESWKRDDEGLLYLHRRALGASAASPLSRYRYPSAKQREDLLSALELSAVDRLWREQSERAEWNVSIVGPFDEATARSLAELPRPKRRAGATAKATRERFKPGVYLFDDTLREKVEGVILWPLPLWTSASHTHASLLPWLFEADADVTRDALGARFAENGARTPYWQSNTLLHRDADFLRYNFETSLDQVGPILRSLRSLWDRLAQGRMDAADVGRGRHAEHQFALRQLLTTQSLGWLLYKASAHDLDAERALNIASELQVAEPEDIANVVKTLEFSQSIVALRGPAARLRALTEDLNLPIRVEPAESSTPKPTQKGGGR